MSFYLATTKVVQNIAPDCVSGVIPRWSIPLTQTQTYGRHLSLDMPNPMCAHRHITGLHNALESMVGHCASVCHLASKLVFAHFSSWQNY